MPNPQRLIIAITGASGAVYGLKLLQQLKLVDKIETHLLVSEAGELNLRQELGLSRRDVEPLADVVHDVRDVGASIASGSFRTLGMVVAPCSMKTLAAIAHGYADNLITRAADVVLKERRRLVLMARETPLSLIHLKNMVAATEAGAIVMPPVPSFYHRPASIDTMVEQTIGRVLEQLGIRQGLEPAWQGMPS